jgi:alpha-mannosidase
MSFFEETLRLIHKNALGGVVLSLMLAASALGQEARSVWKIGDFNGSSFEFGGRSSQSVIFVISENQAQDWPPFQQAVVPERIDKAVGRRIQFELRDAPRGIYRLKLGLIMLTPRVPVVELDVNGHRGRFFQRPEVDYREGNLEGAILPQYGIGSMTMEIPARFLRQGRNEIALAAVTDPLSTKLPGGDITDDAVLTYDALELTNIPNAKPATGVLSAEAKPTVFYKREGGKLLEVVSVMVRWNEMRPSGEVRLSLADWKSAQGLNSNYEFGEERREFLVPEFSGAARATVTINALGRSYNFSQTLRPARKWTVYMVPHEHLDVGYSDFQTKLAELHARVIDDAMEMSTAFPEFKFSLDGYWQAQAFLEGRTESEKQGFYQAVRDRKIYVPAQHSVMLTGFGTAETLLRSFYGSYKLNRAAGGPWGYVNITDVPSYTWSYASILSASGIKYFSAAANADRGPTLMLGDLHRHSPFWWEGPDGSRVLVWYARHYHQIRSEFGLPPVVATGYEGLSSFLNVYERPDYTSDAVLLHGSQWENTSLYAEQASLARRWNNTFAYPTLEFSGFGEAIEKIAGRATAKLPVVRGDGGPYWEDGIASDAFYAAMERETERRALSAEKLATVASLVDTRTRPSRRALDDMWDNILLMNEHTWGWGRSVKEPRSEDSTRELAYKRQRATIARDAVDYLLDRAMTTISGQIETPSRALVVFNTLNWTRNGWVEFDLQKTRELVELESQRRVEFEVLEDHADYQRIRFQARDVPALGYRTYQVRDKAPNMTSSLTASASVPTETQGSVQADAATSPAASMQTQSNTIENSFYRVTLDPQTGAVRSIYDKQLKRELVDSRSPYRFNQYVYVTGGDEFPSQLLTYRKWSPVARLTEHRAEAGRLVSISRTPVGTVARLESRAVNTPRISTEIILFDNEKKIEFVNRVRKDEVYKKEGIYFAFPFNIRSPQFQFDVQTAAVNPAKDMIPGAGKEWFSSQNWASVGGDGVTVALFNKDSFLWTFGDIVRGTWPTVFSPKNATAFSYVMNNYWNTNYVGAQGGDFTFRYVLASARELSHAELNRMGWEETTPLERTLVKSQDQTYPVKRSLPAAKMSFLQTDSPSILLSTWKTAEDGDGSVLRFIELAGARGRVNVSSPLLQSPSAQSCNAMEDCDQPLRNSGSGFSFEVGPRQIITTRVRGRN